MPLLTGTNIQLLEKIVSDQRQILTNVFNGTDATTIPQVWTLCEWFFSLSEALLAIYISFVDQEVLEYYVNGMRDPDDVTLLWADDTWDLRIYCLYIC